MSNRLYTTRRAESGRHDNIHSRTTQIVGTRLSRHETKHHRMLKPCHEGISPARKNYLIVDFKRGSSYAMWVCRASSVRELVIGTHFRHGVLPR